MSYTRFLWVLVLASGLANAAPVPIDGTFTYQAQIKQNGSPANGTFDFQFRLFDDGVVGQGASVGATLTLNDVALVNGQLSTTLKFGNSDLIGANQLFLEIGIRDGASNQPYTLLNPRQRLTEVPFASYADHADFAIKTGTNSVDGLSIVDGTVTGADIADGAIKSADIDSTQVQRRVSQVCAPGSAIRTVAQDGTVICEATGGAGGGVTSITAGTGLTGGTITTSGTIAIAAGGVGSTQINTTQVQRRSAAMLTACAGTNQSIKTIAEDGTVTCEADDAGTGGGSGWALTGNALTGTEFLGSNNGFPVTIKANNSRAAQYERVSGSVNGTVNGTGINVLEGDPANAISTGVLGGTVSGGGRQVTGSGANPNSVTGNYGTVAGGYSNTAGSGTATAAIAATVGGGHANNATAHDATVAGGAQNTASARQATVGGGNFNVASGINSLIPGGRANTASGDNSVVLGNCGTSTAAGAVLIAAVTTPSDCISGIVTASSTPGTVSIIAGSGGVVLAPGAGTWSGLSDRNSKHGIEPVDSASILNGVLAMPIATWTYNSQEDKIRHMGPMAQDFYSAFSLGEDERRISTVDADGVALAAIQGLHEKMERENAELKQRNAELESKNAEMEQRLNRLEQTLLGTERNAGR
jgi:hypothetical protein